MRSTSSSTVKSAALFLVSRSNVSNYIIRFHATTKSQSMSATIRMSTLMYFDNMRRHESSSERDLFWVSGGSDSTGNFTPVLIDSREMESFLLRVIKC